MAHAPDNPAKEGLQAALDFTKFTLAMAGAAIAFLLNSDMLKNVTDSYAKWLVTAALCCFGVSAIGGVLVLMQGASSLANAKYNLDQRYLQIPGMINVFGLMFGFLFATVFIITVLWGTAPYPPAQEAASNQVNYFIKAEEPLAIAPRLVEKSTRMNCSSIS